MLNTEEIQYLKELYAIIFEENADNSKEFITFANGIPHPLRIKVEDWLVSNSNIDKFYNFDRNKERLALMDKMEAARELDLFVTNYIENNYD